MKRKEANIVLFSQKQISDFIPYEYSSTIKTVVFCIVTPCRLVSGTDVLKEPATSIFYPEDGRDTFIRNFRLLQD
jgi:hypothetical protein